jgi:hypothetical protein
LQKLSGRHQAELLAARCRTLEELELFNFCGGCVSAATPAPGPPFRFAGLGPRVLMIRHVFRSRHRLGAARLREGRPLFAPEIASRFLLKFPNEIARRCPHRFVRKCTFEQCGARQFSYETRAVALSEIIHDFS